MRYGVALPNYGELAQPAHLLRIAQHAEAAGLDSVWVSDHVIVPTAVDSVYPYDRAAVPQAANLKNLERFYDALTTLAFIAGATTRIRLGVSAYVLPIRNPITTAKTVATLDALSGGRIVFAVGSGWLAEEFAVLQIPFAERGARTDEYIQICKACWTENEVRLEGRYYRAAPFRCAPKPVQQPHPPIWVGGNGARALQRAARLGNGWHPIDLDPAEMQAKAAVLRQRCAAIGRDPKEMTISLRAPIAVLADVAAYATAGVDYLVLNPHRGSGLDQVLGDIDAIATVSRSDS
jgi:probable F420-dependent oxidoreductase